MNRKKFISFLSVLPWSVSRMDNLNPVLTNPALESNRDRSSLNTPKSIAAIVTEIRPNSHAEVILGKYLEGYNRDNQKPYPESKLVSIFTEQVPDNDMSRMFSEKYNVPVFPTVMDALTLGGDTLAVDGVLLIGEHGSYPFNEKEQKLYPRYEMFLKITDVFRKYYKSLPVFNDKHLSWNWRQAKRMVEISRELGFPMLAGSSVPVAYRVPAVDTPYGVEQKHAVAISFSGLDIYGFHLLEALQSVVERRKGGETGVEWVQCLEGEDCWNYMEQTAWVRRLFTEAIKNSLTKKDGNMKELVKKPAVFIIQYKDGMQAAAFLMTGLVEDFTVAIDLAGEADPFSTLMALQNGKPHHHFSCLVKNIEEMFTTGIPPYPVERTLLASGMLDFALESRFRKYQKLKTPELSEVQYRAPRASHFCMKGWGTNGKLIE